MNPIIIEKKNTGFYYRIITLYTLEALAAEFDNYPTGANVLGVFARMDIYDDIPYNTMTRVAHDKYAANTSKSMILKEIKEAIEKYKEGPILSYQLVWVTRKEKVDTSITNTLQ